jgi:citronellyl-CoA dehydrogenase
MDRALDHPLFAEEHQDLLESMRSWVQAEMWPYRYQWEESTWPRELLPRMGELGYLGLSYPEEWGGQGGDLSHALVRAEALSYSLSGGANMGILVHTDMATPPVEMLGSDEQKEEFLRPAISGEATACLGISEPGAGSDVASIRTRAKRDGDDWLIRGEKVFITNGMRADWCLLLARTGEEGTHDDISLFLVPLRRDGKELPGLSASPLEKMGMHASDTAQLLFDDLRIPGRYLLGEEGQGFRYISWELQGERLLGALGCVAGAERALEITLQYTKEREAFGRPIGKFQSLRFQLAEMATEIDAARQLVYHAAWLFQRGDYPVREISEAKLLSAQMLCRVADRCLQMHGGWGYMQEYDIERIYRDARLNRIGAGTDEIMLEIISRLLEN